MKKSWVSIKILILIIVAGVSLIQKHEKYEDAPPPIFIYFVVAVSAFVFSLGFFKGLSIHRNLSKGNFKNSPLKIFKDPLPFYHLAACSAIISGIRGVIHAWIESVSIAPISYFYISIGLPVLVSVYIANNRFIKDTGYNDHTHQL